MPAKESFIRKTSLSPDEYQTNFTITDNDIIDTLTSADALAVTALIPAIYFRLKRAPRDCWEREGVLHLTGSLQGRELMTAWEQLRQLCGVSNSTLSKALKWMHAQGVLGYDARKNGIGIRIFFNRAATSIRKRGEQKNLRLVPAPIPAYLTPVNRTPFKEQNSKNDLDISTAPAAPKNSSTDNDQSSARVWRSCADSTTNQATLDQTPAHERSMTLQAVALQQAINALKPEIAASIKRENDHTREWFLKFALPKAVRVAQHETYDLLRAKGLPSNAKHKASATAHHTTPAPANRAAHNIVAFLAEACQQFERCAESAAVASEQQTAYRKTARELNELCSSLVTASPPTPEDLESRLTQIEDSLTAALWAESSSTERETWRQEAQTELRDYQARMDSTVFEDTVRRRIKTKLQAQHQLPRLSLFYL